MAQVKPSLTLDVNVGPSSNFGIGGSGTSLTPRSHQNAVAAKANIQIQASAQPHDPRLVGHYYDPNRAYVANHDTDPSFDHVQDNGGFSSDEDAQDAYAAATQRLRAGNASAGARATQDENHESDHQLLRRQYSRYSGHDSDSSVEMDDYGSPHHHNQALQDDMYDDQQIEEEEEEEDDDDDLSSSPSIPDENIDFDLVYALHNFVATVEGQATVHKGNSLTLLDDSNSYWWLVRVLRTQEVGYIPAENIETPFERLARLNKHRNVDLTSATDDDHIQVPEKIYTSHLVKQRNAEGHNGVSVHSGKLSALSRRAQGAPAPFPKDQQNRNKPGVIFGPPTYLEHSGDEYSDYDEYDQDQILEDGQAEEYDIEEAESDQDDENSNNFSRMEPDDGMEWDDNEAEMIQREQEANNLAQSRLERQDNLRPVQHTQARLSTEEGRPSEQGGQQTNSPASLLQRDSNVGHTDHAPTGASHTSSSPQPPTSLHAGQGRPSSTYSPQNTAPNSFQVSQASASSVNGSTGQTLVRTASADRISSSSSAGLPYDSSFTTDPNGTLHPSAVLSHLSAGSTSSLFLPSHIQAQRERSHSDASANSLAQAGDSLSSSTSPEKTRDEKKKFNRRSKADDSADSANEEKSAKKRSSVFAGLFSRKDKKDRKSGSFAGNEDRESIITGRSSEDSFAGPSRGRASSATTSIHAANAGMSPGQSIGMGRAVQERDRAQQEAYQRQFLSGSLMPGGGSNPDQHRMSSDPSNQWSNRSQSKPARPGSLIGPSGSTPVLSVLRVFAGEGIESDSTFKTVLLNETIKSSDLLGQALQRFGVPAHDRDHYVLTIKRLEGDERPLEDNEHPLQLFNSLTEMSEINIPTVKRSSVGSISSVSSNLSTHPAIARLGNDFSDDHAVKFYISRKDSLRRYNHHQGDSYQLNQSEMPYNQSHASTVNDLNPSIASSLSRDGQPSNPSSVASSDTADTIQSPTARFSLRLLIFPSDLPEGIVFDPQTNALVPKQALEGRPPQIREPAEGISLKYREKVLSFPRNTTVAEVVEVGLEHFGIVEGVVEGGDDVEDRPSRRRSKLHIKYGLAVEGPDGERALTPSSKILDAYQILPAFRTSSSNRRSVDGKRLGPLEDIQPNDPVFILRQVHTNRWKSPRTTSPSEQMMNSKQDLSQARTDNKSSQLKTVEESPKDLAGIGAGTAGLAAGAAAAANSSGMSRQEIIAAQRAAAHERRAAVLGTQRNAEQGVDLVLADRARLRSSKIGDSGQYRYSYVPADGEERDISAIIEEVLKDQMSANMEVEESAAREQPSRSLSSNNPKPLLLGNKKSMQSDSTSDDYRAAASFPRNMIPLSALDTNLDFNSQNSSVAPLSFGKDKIRSDPRTMNSDLHRPTTEGDLLESLIRNQYSGGSAIQGRIDQVMNRVADVRAPSRGQGAESPAVGIRSGSRGPVASPTFASSANSSGRGTPTTGTIQNHGAPASISSALAYQAHRKQASIGSELSNSRDTSSPATGGTGSAGTHATTTTMPTPMSTLVSSGVGFGATATGGAGVANGGAGPGAVGSRTHRNRNLSRTGSSTSGSSTPIAMLESEELGLDQLYTIVDAAARRDPRRIRLMMYGSGASFSTDIGSNRPDSKLANHLMADTEKESLKTEPGGLFAPQMPFVEDKKTREAYSGIVQHLGSIDETLDQLLVDAMRVF